jgi:hypothetical protein
LIDLGEQQVKNITQPVRAWHIGHETSAPAAAAALALPDKPPLGGYMKKSIGSLGIVGIFSWSVANAQTTPSALTTAFDGTYTPVSSTIGHAWSGKGPYCPETRPGPLTIAQGQAILPQGASSRE